MAELVFRTGLGTLSVQGWMKDTMRRAATLGEEVAGEGRTRGDFIAFEGDRAYLKGGPIQGRTGARFALRRALFRARVPRINEYFNLSWLTERHFQVALPLAAGVFARRGLPTFQFLLTREVPGARTLYEFLDDATRDERAGVLVEIAREVARMHAIGFLHHDLFARNLLVLGPDRPRRVVFLDAWAGGPPTQLRSPAYDVGSFFLDAVDLFSAAEQDEFLRAYFDQREGQGRPVDEARFLVAAMRARRALHRKLTTHPARLRGRPVPAAEWSPRLPRSAPRKAVPRAAPSAPPDSSASSSAPAPAPASRRDTVPR